MRNFILLIFAAIVFFTTEAYGAWIPLAPGMVLGTFAANKPSPVGDSRITILRIDPKLWELVLIGKSWNGEADNQTAKGWCKNYKLIAAINAGMFGVDNTTHVGCLVSKGHVNSRHANKYMVTHRVGQPERGKSSETAVVHGRPQAAMAGGLGRL